MTPLRALLQAWAVAIYPFAYLALSGLAVLLSPGVNAQSAPHPGAEKAMERIVLEQDFGDDLKLHSREILSIAENPKTPGLNGLMFMRGKGASPDMEVTASVQWFEKREELLPFYRDSPARHSYSLMPIGDTIIWTDRENTYLWTDREHFVVGLIGSPAPSRKIIEAWLALIDSNPPDLAKLPTTAR